MNHRSTQKQTALLKDTVLAWLGFCPCCHNQWNLKHVCVLAESHQEMNEVFLAEWTLTLLPTAPTASCLWYRHNRMGQRVWHDPVQSIWRVPDRVQEEIKAPLPAMTSDMMVAEWVLASVRGFFLWTLHRTVQSSADISTFSFLQSIERVPWLHRFCIYCTYYLVTADDFRC